MSTVSRLKNLNIASLSDIHLGHNKNPAIDIINNLNLAFPDNAETAKLDMLFIVGDIFDTLLFLSRDEIADIKLWIANVLRLAKKHDIVVRILEGTPSHDRKQSMLFPLLNEIGSFGADVKHVTELSIEHIDKFDIDILYVPDEWTDSPEKTIDQVIDLLQHKGLSKVDFALMHGTFSYQLPEMIKCPRHNEQQYLSIVKEYIFVGHIHHHSTFKRIIAHGSFDRLAHGEEEPKGHIRLMYDSEGNRRIKFVENKNARVFKTINCTSLDVPAILEKVSSVVLTLPCNAYVRIEAEKDNPIFTTFEVLIRQFPLVNWSKKAIDIDEDSIEFVNIIDDETIFIPITITKENILPLIMDRIIKQNVPDLVKDRCDALLREVA